MSMRIGRGTRAMQLLAVRLIERRHPEDAIVLGDAMSEHGLGALITGRSRPVVFEASLGRTAGAGPTDGQHSGVTRFVQPGVEAIYNVPQFAADPSSEKWDHIWSHWFTTQRGTYQALVRQGLVSRDTPFHELDWSTFFPWRDEDVELAYNLYRVHVPKGRKRPLRTFLMNITRRSSNNPRTREQYFHDPYQLPLL